VYHRPPWRPDHGPFLPGLVRGLHYNGPMRALRWLYLVALAIWLGGLVVLGATVAPGLFDALAPTGVVQGRQAAGEAFGVILDRFHLVSYGAAATLVVTLVAMGLLGPRPRPWAPRLVLLLAMAAATLVVHVPVGRTMTRLQREAGGTPRQFDAQDPRRVEFEWLHRLSTALLLFNVGGGLVLLAWETRT
jgi:hypothetical protein